MQSPSKLQTRIQELGDLVARERALVGGAEQRMREVQARLDKVAWVSLPACLCDSRHPATMARTRLWWTCAGKLGGCRLQTRQVCRFQGNADRCTDT